MDVWAFITSLFKRSAPRDRSLQSSPIAGCYKTLGVKPGASPEAVKAAYEAQSRRLTADLQQFSHDHRLKQRMEELIRELNDAYQAVIGECNESGRKA